MLGRNSDALAGPEQQPASIPPREPVREQRTQPVACNPGDDRDDDAEVTGGREDACDRHDHLARDGDAAAVDGHEQEHDEEAAAGDPLADCSAHGLGLWPTLPRACAERSARPRSRPGRRHSTPRWSWTGENLNSPGACFASTSTSLTKA